MMKKCAYDERWEADFSSLTWSQFRDIIDWLVASKIDFWVGGTDKMPWSMMPWSMIPGRSGEPDTSETQIIVYSADDAALFRLKWEGVL